MMLGPGMNCGGPLVCISCAMKYAQAYRDNGKPEWAELYRNAAKRLRKAKEAQKEVLGTEYLKEEFGFPEPSVPQETKIINTSGCVCSMREWFECDAPCGYKRTRQ